MSKKEIIRTIYLYLFSLVGLVLVVIGSVRAVNLGLKTYIFKNADRVIIYPEMPRPVTKDEALRQAQGVEVEASEEEQEKFKKEQADYQRQEARSRREREITDAIAMIVVGAPLFFYHWKLVQRDR